VRHISLVALFSTAFVLPLGAQTLTDNLNDMFTFGACGSPLCLDVDANFHGQHYIPSAVGEAQRLIGFMPAAIAASLGQIPFTAANSGTALVGFQDGAPMFESISAGPILGERAQTLGKGTYYVGANVTGINLSSIRGVSLSRLEFNFPHQNVQDAALGNPSFEQDIVEVASDLQINLMAFALTAAFGITDRVDIGVLVPFVRANMTGNSLAIINNPFGPVTGAHQFAAGAPFTARSSTEGSASGIGDIGVRLKANLHQTSTFGVGVSADVRLPVGDEANFLGTGSTSARVVGVVSGRSGSWTPHLNAGVAIRTGDFQNHSVLAILGFDRMVSPRFTFVGELAMDLQLGASALIAPEPLTFTAPEVRQLNSTNIPNLSDHLLDASVGFKYQSSADLRLVVNGLIPLLDGGVRPSAMWTIGLEKVF